MKIIFLKDSKNGQTGEPIKIGASKRVSYKNTEAKKKK